ncbi:hypothetical protein [Actinokineospora inagensis]|uniref:hypothetical protein n=1 Tax=Actinokineospora inagensis TaxID=103730 RepID=UPI00047E870C|nr:hypothetical protein [Actinokineospora inagensis]
MPRSAVVVQLTLAAALSTSVVLGTSVEAAAEAALSYSYEYPLALETAQTPESLTTSVATDFRRFFPFDSDCPRLPPIGGRCDLYVLPGIPVPSNPVQVIDRTSNSWTFQSLPGHTEGAGRTIVFSFEPSPTGLELHTRANGPYTLTAAATIYSGGAYFFWHVFADKVSQAF